MVLIVFPSTLEPVLTLISSPYVLGTPNNHGHFWEFLVQKEFLGEGELKKVIHIKKIRENLENLAAYRDRDESSDLVLRTFLC